MIQGRGMESMPRGRKVEDDVNTLSAVMIGLFIVLHDVEQVTLIFRHYRQGLFSNLYSNTILNEAKYLKGHQGLATPLSFLHCALHIKNYRSEFNYYIKSELALTVVGYYEFRGKSNMGIVENPQKYSPRLRRHLIPNHADT